VLVLLCWRVSPVEGLVECFAAQCVAVQYVVAHDVAV